MASKATALVPAPSSSPRAPLRTLTAAFVAWKALILLLSFGALVGPDYDTSTSLFFAVLRSASPSASPPAASTPPAAGGFAAALASRLTRWDAIYFVHGASVGHVYEQEWAFSPFLALCLRHLASLTRSVLGLPADDAAAGAGHLEAVMGIALAHASHYVAALALYQLTLLLSGGRNTRLALLAALLCVVSPAGVFLSAPYAESPFSALSFVGIWILAAGYTSARGSLRRSAAVVLAGAVLGVATAVRSNGLASGLLFAVEALQAAAVFVQRPGLAPVVAAGAAGVGGMLVALGSVIPQYIAYTMFCAGPDGPLRPWCEKTIPSIYSYVQDVYW